MTSLARGDPCGLWWTVKAMSPNSTIFPLRVKEAVGEDNIAIMYGAHYKGIMNCVVNNNTENDVRRRLRNSSLCDFSS